MGLMKKVAAWSIVAAVCVGCREMPVDGAGARARLLELDRAFAALSESDGYIEAYHHYSADDVLLLPPGAGPREGREDIYQSDLEEGAGGQLTWEVMDGSVAGSGELGWTWGEWAFSAEQEDGTSQESRGKYLFIWKKAAGEWRMAVNIWNDNPDS